MNTIKLLIFLIFISFAACKDIDRSSDQNAEKIGIKKFPKDWIGEYYGDLSIYGVDSLIQKIPMSLKILAKQDNGLYPWIIQYGEDDIRKYAVETKDTVTGHYIMDEQNGILLDGYAKSNHFISRFEVMNSDLIVDYELLNNGIKMEIFVSQKESIKTTGDTIIVSDTIPAVRTFSIMAMQSAMLIKKEISDNE